MLTVAN